MFTKVMKGLPKRIAAFVMAVLMFFSLMPIDPSIVLAEGEENTYTYTFKVTDDTEGAKGLDDVAITLYSGADVTEAVSADSYTWKAKEAAEGEDATSVAGTYTLTSNTDLTEYYYVISADGYKLSTRTQLGTLEEGKEAYEVALLEKDTITLSFSNINSENNVVELVVENTFTPEISVLIDGEEELTDDEKNAIFNAIAYSTSLEENSTVLTLENGVVTAGTTASETLVTITATFAGNESYKPATATFQVKVVDKYAQEIVFDYTALKEDTDEYPEGITVDAENNKVTYTTDYLAEELNIGIDVYRNEQVASNVTPTYAIKDTDGNASVDVVKYEDGKFTIIGAGEAVITVSVDGDATYAEASKTLIIVVEKLEPEFSFGETNEFNLICGEYKDGETTFTAPTLEYSEDLEADEIKYTLSDENGVIDADKFNTNQTIGFTGKVGTVTITASYAGDDKYQEASAAYTINVGYASLTDVAIQVNGANPAENAWHNAGVVVTLPEGYSYCETTEGATWSDDGTTEYTHTLSTTNTEDSEEQVTNEEQKVELLIKNNTTGAIGLFTYEYKYDDKAASVSAIKSDTKNLKDAIMDFFKFIFGDDVDEGDKKATIDISISAEGAPVQSVYYFVDNTSEFSGISVEGILQDESIAWIKMEDIEDTDEDPNALDLKLDITEAGTKVIYVKVVDEAGNISCASTDGLVFDATAPELNVEIQTSPVNDYYLGDVEIKVSARETGVVSGIKSIQYVIWKDDVAGIVNTLFSANEVTSNTQYDDLVADTDSLTTPLEKITVDAEANDSQNVKVVITVEDNAGNVTTVEKPLKIAATAPSITSGTWSDNDYEVELTVSSRADVFDADGLVVSGKVKINGEESDIVKDTHYTITWSDTEDSSVKTATIQFIADGAYSDVKASYKDKVNRTAEATLNDSFTKDKNAPTAEITIGQSTWDTFLEKITFGLWSSAKVELTITATDSIDETPTIEYIKMKASEIMTLDALKVDTVQWISYDAPVTIPTEDGNDTFVIYVRVTDDNNNTEYFSSNGYIVDMKTDGDDSLAITEPDTGKENYTIGENQYECYRDDVTLTITAIEDAAGIQKLEYKIGKADALDSITSTPLYSYSYDATNETNPQTEEKSENAVVKYDTYTSHPKEFQDTIVVSAKDYNYDGVTVWVKLTDLAGNETEETITLNILDEKSEIKLSNTPISPVTTTEAGVDYYDSIYTTEFTIHSRASIFNAEGVEIKVLDDDGNPVDASLYEVKYDESYAEGDDHKFTVTFKGNAKYNFSIDYTDAIGEKASYTDVLVVDREKPTAEVKVNESVWNKFLSAITFGWWSNDTVTVYATGSDALGDVTVEYDILENVSVISKDALENPTNDLGIDWKPMPSEGVPVSESSAYVVVVRVTDTAKNVDYFSSNGFIVDKDNDGDVVSVETSAQQTAGYYTDAEIPLVIQVAEDGAGIQKITYQIVKDNAVANEGTLYELVYNKDSQNITSETYAESATVKKDTVTGFAEEFSQTITITSKDYNSKDVYVTVTLTDNAGNETTLEKFSLPIAVETPKMEVTYVDDPEVTGTDKNQVKHYQDERKAKIVITSRDDMFDKDKVSIVVNATKETEEAAAYSISWEEPKESGIHVAYVTFPENARYDFTVNYTNKVNVAVAQYEETFVIDNKKPTVSLNVGEASWWAELLEDITFGFWDAEIEISAEYSDVTSDIQSVEYIKTSEVTPLTEAQLDQLGWAPYTKAIPVDADKTLVVYVKVMDYAGNKQIVSSKGIIVDTTEKLDIALSPTTQPKNEYYNADVVVDVVVKDMWGEMTSYSGINKVVYWVTADDNVTQEEKVLYEFTEEEPTHDKLVSELVFNKEEVVIDADKNNSDKVVLHVKATDNAGNSFEATKKFKIDTIQPKIILDYEPDEAIDIIKGYGLYDAVRSAKVVITERASSFDDAAATNGIDIVVQDVNEKVVSDAAYTISDWKHEGSGDTATHTATITFAGDGYYTVAVGYTDIAGNVNEPVVTTVSENPYQFMVDTKDADVKLIPSYEDDIYTKDFTVSLAVDDGNLTSGLQKVEYWIKNGEKQTAGDTLYVLDGNAATIKLEQLLTETLPVNAQENNSCAVVLHVTVTDNVGRIVEKELTFDIDIDKPIVSVSFDVNKPATKVGDRGYYKSERTATITVEERAAHFDSDEFKKGITIFALNYVGRDVEEAYEITETHNGDIHTYVIKFKKDANYEFNIASYTDKAGLTNDSDIYVENQSTTPNEFTIDRLQPNGTITATGQFVSNSNLSWLNEFLQVFSFGLWSPSNVTIAIVADDATSPVKSIEYYKTSTFTGLSEEQLKAEANWIEADTFSVESDDIFVVYAKITDQTGNVRYISSNGIIVDETKPVFETYSPEITITPERPVNGIYDGNVRVDVGVIDPIAGENLAYSGLRTITYEVLNMGVKTQEGTLYNFKEKYPEGNPTQEQLCQSWNEEDIIVDASKNNSNKVVVKVIATDNAGNQTVAMKELKIDITKPVIEVSYDNNNGDATFADGVYYNSNRIATIKVTERNFDANLVNAVITNTDGTVPTISGWTTTAGTGNGDNTVHTATIVYAADGDYTFAISAKDKVGNTNEAVNYGNSQAPTAFTIDKTVPVISITYDNNDFANENYYKADRTATISILEHNFDASRVAVTITATDNGQPVNVPAISNWSKSGDTYTATVNYSVDALYTFDISYSDKAQNEAVDFAQQSFYVDKTMPQMSITEIVDQSANNKDKIGFVITATDTNFDVFTPVLTAVVKTETGFTTKELNIASITDIANGRVYTISNIDTDGIYRITCTLVDKAGNAYNAVTLHQADGTPYVTERTAEDTLVEFSVNRDGSTFEVDEATKEVLDNYYVYDVKEDVVIVEVNANQLTSNTVSLNGKELVEGTDFTIATEGGNGAWLRYIYTLNKELFAEEGEYTIVVSSVDEAENNAFSDVKNTKVAFVVDRTAPVVTISGLETNGRYQTDAQTVTLIPTDDGGAVKSIVVNQVDVEGNVIKTLQEELSGETLETALEANDGQISFVIPSGTYDYIEIVCADCSVNETGSTNTVEILIEDVLITENELALIWATYQYAIIGGGAAAVAVPTGIVLFRRRLKLKVK